MGGTDGRRRAIRKLEEVKPEGWQTQDFAFALVCAELSRADAILEALLLKRAWRTPTGELVAQDERLLYAVREARSRGLATPAEEPLVTYLRVTPAGAELAERLQGEAA